MSPLKLRHSTTRSAQGVERPEDRWRAWGERVGVASGAPCPPGAQLAGGAVAYA
jgi:hypothetical protein